MTSVTEFICCGKNDSKHRMHILKIIDKLNIEMKWCAVKGNDIATNCIASILWFRPSFRMCNFIFSPLFKKTQKKMTQNKT